MVSFLLIGQSNMAGRGYFGEVPHIENPLCKMLRNGKWQPMSEPICPDRPIFTGKTRSGVGLSASFADAYANAFGEAIGLIPCADGGTRMEEWQPGEVLFDHAVMQTKLAMRSSTLAGILWHQGEADSTPERAPLYHDRFLNMLNTMKKELGIGDLPVIVGELGRFFVNREGKDPAMIASVNDTLRQLANEIPNAGFVTSEGLESRGDNLHFSSASYREFGLRYFAKYREITGK